MTEPNDPPKPSRKELEKEHRRNEILKAARKFFIEKGFANTTLEEIAQYSEFGKGTLYNYFANKEDLLWGLIKQFFAENITLATMVIESEPGTARDKLRKYAATILTLGPEREFFRVMIREGYILKAEQYPQQMQAIHADLERVWQIIARPLQADMDAGLLRQGDAMQLAGLFDMMIRSYGMGTQSPYHPGIRMERDAVVELIVATFFDGMRP